MLSDEEKKAIERLIIYKDKIKDELYPIIDFEEEKAIGIVLNLIEKQSKQIEELKNGQIDFWISDKEIEERIRNKFVSNDKIKAKIEEIKEEIKTCYIYKKTGRCTNNCKEACFYYDVIDILQRFLEEK